MSEDSYLCLLFDHNRIGQSDFFMKNKVDNPFRLRKLSPEEKRNYLKSPFQWAHPVAHGFNDYWFSVEPGILLKEGSDDIYRKVYKITEGHL